jgi:hypothetical protein
MRRCIYILQDSLNLISFQKARLLTDAAYAAKMWSVFQMEQWIGWLNLIRVAAALMAV